MRYFSRIPFLPLVLASLSIAYGQTKVDAAHPVEKMQQWFDGRIILSDGTELKGPVRFDPVIGVLYFLDGEYARSFIAKSVSASSYNDEAADKERRFLSLEYKSILKDSKFFATSRTLDYFYFFEVLKEMKEFAVLAKTSPIEVKEGYKDDKTITGYKNELSPGFFQHGSPQHGNDLHHE